MDSKEKQKVDLCFVIDTTGSMGSWVNEAKQKIQLIVEKIEKICSLRVGVILYRDYPPQDTSYVTSVLNFGENDEKVQSFFRKYFTVDGGGDFEESLTAGIYDILRMDWRKGLDVLKSCLIITDAPVHGLGNAGDGFPSYDPSSEYFLELVHSCAETGITVNCVACGNNEYTLQCLKNISKIGKGLFLQINQSQKFAEIMESVILNEIYQKNAAQKIFSLLKENSKEILKCNTEEGRIESSLQLLKEKEVKFNKIDEEFKRKEEEFSKDSLEIII